MGRKWWRGIVKPMRCQCSLGLAGAGNFFAVFVFAKEEGVGFVADGVGGAFEGADGGSEFVEGAEEVAVDFPFVGKRDEAGVDLGKGGADVGREGLGVVAGHDFFKAVNGFGGFFHGALGFGDEVVGAVEAALEFFEGGGGFLRCFFESGHEAFDRDGVDFVEDGGDAVFDAGEASLNGGEDGVFTRAAKAGGFEVGVVVEVDEELAGQEVGGFQAGAEAIGEGFGEVVWTRVSDADGEVFFDEALVELDEDGDALDFEPFDELVGDFFDAADTETAEFDGGTGGEAAYGLVEKEDKFGRAFEGA